MDQTGSPNSSADWLFDALADGMVLIGSDWRVLFVNRTAEALLGVDRREVAGGVIGGDFEVPASRMAVYREVMESRRPRTLSVQDESEVLRGRVFDLEVHPSPTGGIALVFRDVTERARLQEQARARAEEAERRILESEALREISRDLISRVEPARVLERIARHARDLLGAGYAAVASVAETGETVWLAVVGNRVETWQATISPPGKGMAGRIVTSNAPLVIEGFPENPEFPPAEFPAQLSEGMRSALGVPLTTPAGGAFGALITGWRTPVPVGRREIELALALAQPASIALENARLFQESLRAQQAAEAANLAKSQFLATMSHEIRTPINAVVGYTELLDMGLAGPIGAAQRSYLDRIRASTSHLLMLVEDILDLSQIEASEIRLRRERLRVDDVLNTALALIRPAAAERGVEIAEPPECESDLGYLGDETRVRQILLNLLSNAVKFTERGGCITLACGRGQEAGAKIEGVAAGEGPWTWITVEDTGVGIPREQLGRVFEPFVQVDTGYTRSRGGSGLGLAISRRLARLMGGDLTVRSAPAEGSCFTLWLPAALPGAAAPQPQLEEWTPGVEPPRGLTGVGQLLIGRADEIVARLGERLRRDAATPMAQSLERHVVEDHYPTLIVDLGVTLAVLGQAGGERGQASIIRDASEIQRVILALHGEQRASLGWTEEALRREFQILREEIEAFVRRELRQAQVETDAALAIVHARCEQAEHISVDGLRSAFELRSV